MLNQCQVIGRLGKDPELRYMSNGDAVANYSVAAGEKWKDKATGEMKETTEWFRVVCYGRQAEIAGEYLRKGSLVYVSGKIKTREYEKDGAKQRITELHAYEMKMLEKPDMKESPAPEPARESRAPATQKVAGTFDDMDDDIPF